MCDMEACNARECVSRGIEGVVGAADDNFNLSFLHMDYFAKRARKTLGAEEHKTENTDISYVLQYAKMPLLYINFFEFNSH